MPSIHIFGGGMSGLTAAFLLEQQQQDYQLFECGLHWGGKLHTTHCDGFAFDHGFQVVQSAYPALDIFHRKGYLSDALAFGSGAWLLSNKGKTLLADPLREFPRGLAALGHPSIRLTDVVQVVRLRNVLFKQPPEQFFTTDTTSTLQYLQNQGFSQSFIEAFFRPFFSGIFLEEALATPASMFKFVFWALAKGKACLMPNGIQTLPNRIAADLNPSRIHLSSHQQPQALPVVSPHKTFYSTAVHYFAVDSDLGLGKFIGLNAEQQGNINLVAIPSAVQTGYAPKGKHLLCVSLKPSVAAQEKTWPSPQVILHEVDQLLQTHSQAKWLDSFTVKQALPADTAYTYKPGNDHGSIAKDIHQAEFVATGTIANPSLNAAILNGFGFVESLNSQQITLI